MMIANPAPEEILYVCNNMRPESHSEIFDATDASVEAFAHSISSAPGFKWVGYHDKKPAAIIGANPQHEGVWSLFGFGTDHWCEIWRAVTKVARRDMMQAVVDAGAHRAHCICPTDHTDTHKWLRLLGATSETHMPGYGKSGQDYTMFAWLKGDN